MPSLFDRVRALPPVARWLVAAALLHTAVVVGYSVAILGVNQYLGPVEVQVATDLIAWRSGVRPWTSLDQLPALFNPYGPLFFWILKTLPPVAGWPYLVGRMVSLACLVAVVVLSGWWVTRRTGRPLAGWLTAALLLTGRPIFEYGACCRVDGLMLLLAFGGYAVVVLGPRTPARLALAVGLMTLAGLTKILAVTPALAAVWYLWPHSRRQAVAVGLSWLALTALGLAGLQQSTAGAFLAIVGEHECNLGKGLDVVFRPVGASTPWVLLVPWLVWTARRRGPGVLPPGSLRPEAIYWACSVVVCLVTATNTGSAWNYLLEMYVSFALLTGVLVSAVWNPADAVTRRLPLLFLAHFLFALGHTTWWTTLQFRIAAERQPDCVAAAALVESLPPDEPVAVLSSLPLKDALLKAGRYSQTDLLADWRDRARALVEREARAGRPVLILDGP